METVSQQKDFIHNDAHVIGGVPEGADALWLVERAISLMSEDKILVHIALDDARIQLLKKLINFFDDTVDVLEFPAWDCLPYDRISPNKEIIGQRVSTLSKLISIKQDKARKPRILLCSVNSISQKVVPETAMQNISFRCETGGQLDADGFQKFLSVNGYERTQTVREPGEFAFRGGIIDVFPTDTVDPYRIDLFGDEIETIRTFDPADQTTIGNAKVFEIIPATEFVMTDDSVERFRKQYRDLFGMAGANDALYEAISEGRRYNGVEHWMPLFFEQLATIFDYLSSYEVSQDHQSSIAYDERITQVKDFYQARQSLAKAQKGKKKKDDDVSLSGTIYHPISVESLYIETKPDAVTLSPFSSENHDYGAKKGRDFSDVRALPDGDVFHTLKDHIESFSKDSKPILIAAYSNGSRERLKTLLENSNIKPVKFLNSFNDIKKIKSSNEIGLVILPLESGFEHSGFVLLTEQDILGDRLTRSTKIKKRKSDNFIREVSALGEGDFVVHMDHGIGRFMGLETLDVAGAKHDCLKLIYANDDRLFVPVENLEVLSKFGGEDTIVQLDKLGGAGWQARKARVKKNLMEMADELLKIAAARQLKQADRLTLSDGIYEEFASRFPYPETDDQLRAISETLEDMAKGTPMDRLICGDVGFGKTEIAIRAAYVAAMAGGQVAIVAPTTLLARQHYQNFKSRFAGTGIRIEQLSRLVSSKDSKHTKQGLRDGSVQIVIGTHALFADAIKFQKLDLLIVDEEQRFGVKQKEKLKSLKENVHVLTLTATPIPRTLQMSLTGVKEMSIIATPPVDRLAVRTFILPFDPVVVREAILREHYRGGQSFYVCPRVKDIEKVKETLSELVPEVKVVTAHGQLAPTDLEARMNAFYDRQYDVLLATNIIESGIDIPTANTLIVHRSDMFGLAQLYQIRGRVGRSKLRAYAYLTYESGMKLNPTAQKRLEVLETLDTLGAGFQLASHDMDIRGSGNLLGEQQSGHIKEVGVELYQQMLEDAVAAARDGVGFDQIQDMDWSPQIQLGTSVLIPESYIEDLSLRMSLYRRAAELNAPEEIESFAAELIDRFGKLPDEVENLLTIIGIKQMCKQAGIEKVDAGPKGAVVTFHKSFSKPAELVQYLGQKPFVKLRPDQKLVRTASWGTVSDRVKGVKMFVKEMSDL